MNKFAKRMPLLSAFAAMAIAGCTTDLNTLSFRAEKLSADSAQASVHLFNIYYPTATNGASADRILELNKQREQIYEASRKTAAVLTVVETARLNYSTNATPAAQTALESALSSLQSNSGSVTSLVSSALAPFSTIK